MSILTKIKNTLRTVSSLLRMHGGPRRFVSRLSMLLRDEGVKGVLHRLRTVSEATPLKDDYLTWIHNYDGTSNIDLAAIAEELNNLPRNPLISLVITVDGRVESKLLAAIASIKNQIYPHWELLLVFHASAKTAGRALRSLVEGERRIRIQPEKNASLEQGENNALERAKGEYIIFLDGNGILGAHALYWIVKEVIAQPEADFVYADEDKIDNAGTRMAPHFKPDWNPDLFLTWDYSGAFKIFRTDVVKKLGGLQIGYGDSIYYDLALRTIERLDTHRIRHVYRILYHEYSSFESGTSVHFNGVHRVESACHAVRRHLERCLIKASVRETSEISGCLRVHYALPSMPQVTLIIPTRNGLELLKLCLESIATKTSYPNYQIIVVDNGSDELATMDYLTSLKGNSTIQVIRDDGPFNFSRLNNLAVKHARGTIIGLLNNDMEVISADWLTEMVSQALRPEIGIVGARLWYPNDTIQHAGVIMTGGVAGHVHKKLARGETGYFGRAVLVQNFVAVTAACLVMRKNVYEEVGGLDEDFAVAFNDVDFCMRVAERGYRNLWTPYAELYHHESASRGYEDTPEKIKRFMNEMKHMQGRWHSAMFSDPAYNPNLHPDLKDFSLASPPTYFQHHTG